MLVSMDGSDHVRQRRLVSAGFTPRMVKHLELQIRQWAESIVDRALQQGECDFVVEIAYKLPMHVIADIVGIPIEDRDWLFTLTNEALQGGLPRTRDHLKSSLEAPDSNVRICPQAGAGEARSIHRTTFGRSCRRSRSKPTMASRTTLSEIELDLFFMLLTIAGSETTRNAVSQGLVALLDHPEQLEQLRSDPGAIPLAVEEILRWSSPVSYFARRATQDTEIRGVPIARGDRVTMWFPSANRDEDVFDQPYPLRHHPEPEPSRRPSAVVACTSASAPTWPAGTRHTPRGSLRTHPRTSSWQELPPTRSLGIFNPILLFMRELPIRVA